MLGKKRSNESNDGNVKKKRTHHQPIKEPTVKIDSYLRTGKILYLKLINFMCHKNFEIDFQSQSQKNASLIIGNNGSGKSAILTAILIGLGRRAMETNRSTNLKELIRKGESSAKIEIHLSNDGVDQYSVEQFGRKIIVIRTLMLSGASKYKILNEKKDVVSKHKNDLDNILLLLNIQINNPICVLTQYLSKAFLLNSNPSKRYELFMNGTQLAQIKETLYFCKKQFAKININLENKEKKAEQLSLQLEELNDKITSLSSIGNLEEQIALLNSELAWFDVNEEENEIITIRATYEENFREKEALRNTYENRDEYEIEIKNKIEAYIKQIQMLKKNNSNQEYKDLKANLIQQNNNLHDFSKNIKRLEEKRKLTEKNIKKLETNLIERKNNVQNHVAMMKENNLEKLNGLKKEKNDNNAIKQNVERDIKSLKNTLEQYRDDKLELNAELEVLKKKKRELESKLKVNNNNENDKLTIYSYNMPNLIKAIETNFRNGKFSKMPLGPLGRYIEVPDEKWCGIIEHAVGNLIKSFAVNSSEDRDLLFSLIKKYCPNEKYTIIKTKFFNQIHDVQKSKVDVPKNANCFMDIIKTLNPTVMNILIDQINIENILTVVDESLATKLSERIENVPRNLSKIYLLNPLSEYYPQPSYRSYGISKRNNHFIQVDMSRHREYVQAQMSTIDKEIGDINLKLIELNKKSDELKKIITEKNSIMSNIDLKLIKIHLNMEEINNIEYPTENEIDILESEKIELENMLITINKSLDETLVQQNLVQETIRKLDNKKQEVNKEILKIESEINQLEDNINKEKVNLSKISANAKYITKKYQDKCNIVLDIENKIKVHNKILNKLINKATLIGERRELNVLNREVITNKIEKLQQEIRKIVGSNKNINIEELKLNYKNLQSKSHELNTLINHSKKTKEKLQAARVKRKVFLHLLETHMRTRITSEFKGLVEIRDYDGYIKIDHNKQILEMHVVPRDKHIKDAVSSIDSLSGGERSFTTLALLLSLWKCVNFPFFCLDEYDVFTDEFTRKLMNTLLFNHAAKHRNRQYIFLTPLDMSQLEIKDHVNIIKLKPVRD